MTKQNENRERIEVTETVDHPMQLDRSDWFAALKRTVREFFQDRLTIWAASLTYFGVLAIFPALLAVVAILGLIGQSATQPLIDNISTLTPGPAKDIATQAVENLQSNQGGAGFALVLGLGIAFWAASNYIAAFIQAANVVWDVEEGRRIWRTLPLRLLVTFVVVFLLVASALIVAFTGPLAKRAGEVIGVGSEALTVWEIAKWPVLILLIGTVVAILYYTTPNVRQPGFRWVTPGSVLAVALWIILSAGFAFYVATFGSYNRTYGSMAGPIVFLIWLWLSNVAILIGAEFNAELERSRQIKAGHPPEEEPFLEPKDETKMRKPSRRVNPAQN